MRNILQGQRGISLTELLVAVVVFAILFLVVDSVFISAHRSSRKAELAADVDQNARIAIERLTREIRESAVSEISIRSGVPDQVIFRSARPTDTSSSFCLRWNNDNEPLADANPDCKGKVTRDGTYTPEWQRWIGYYFDTVTLECQIGAGKSGGCVRRLFRDTALAFPMAGGDVIATFVEDFTMAVSPSSPATFSVTIKAKGQEVVQGSPVPPQRILLNGTTLIRN